ncbi:hypothetical protein AHF37_12422 [Paragonimus kellicotti]|nr:hypothetical protein AHF37_12422 [Paragonimus kellicotti]
MLPDPVSCDLPSGSTVDYLAERKTYQCPITMNEINCQAAITTEAKITLGKFCLLTFDDVLKHDHRICLI